MIRARIMLVPVLAVASIVLGGAANGFWSSSGDGVGSGGTGTTVAVSLTPGAPVADLHPGSSSDVSLTVSNPNRTLVHLDSLALDSGGGTGGFSVDPAHASCSVAALSFTTQTNGGSGWTVPARVGTVDGTLAVELTNALSMSLDAANACQGATASVYLTALP